MSEKRLGWCVAAASVVGLSHQREEMPCQDAFAYRLLPGGTLLVAVADGAGSAARSGEGARQAVDRVMAWLAGELESVVPEGEGAWCELLRGAFAAVRADLAAVAAAEQQALSTFATTLACAIVTDGWLVAGQVGDGAVVAECEGGELLVALGPQRGEYANETCFLTSRDALERLDLFVAPLAPRALVAMTDGMLRLALMLPDYSPHPPFFHPLFSFGRQVEDEQEAAGQLAAFLASRRVCERTEDDKTVVLATRRPPSEPGSSE